MRIYWTRCTTEALRGQKAYCQGTSGCSLRCRTHEAWKLWSTESSHQRIRPQPSDDGKDWRGDCQLEHDIGTYGVLQTWSCYTSPLGIAPLFQRCPQVRRFDGISAEPMLSSPVYRSRKIHRHWREEGEDFCESSVDTVFQQSMSLLWWSSAFSV